MRLHVIYTLMCLHVIYTPLANCPAAFFSILSCNYLMTHTTNETTVKPLL